MKRGPYKAKHNLSGSPEYRIWSAMKRRCTKPNATDYSRYGGRGIAVCDRWMKFENFIADIGRRPSSNHSLERIENDIGYEPINCRWATKQEQQNNKRTTHYVEYRGEKMSIADAVRAAGSLVLRETARNRIHRGWPIDLAVETPNTFRRDPETRCIIRESAE